MQQQEQAIPDSNTENAICDPNEPMTTEFLDPLPFDIVTKVAAYLDQNDCLTCMAVCRSWYLTAPQYIQHAWETVYPMYSHVPRNNRRWEICVGDYAKNIMFHDSDYSKLLFVMQKVVDCRCTKIDYLNLNVPAGIDDAKTKELVSLVKQLAGTTATHLTLNDMSTTLNFFEIIDAHPNLIEFSYRDRRHTSAWKQRQFARASTIQFTCLTNLYLDAYMDTRLYLEPLLRNSPNLRCLAYGPRPMHNQLTNLGRANSYPVIDLDKVFLWCPNLTYLESNGGQMSWRYRESWLIYIKREKGIVPGLRSFMGHEAEGYGPKEIGVHLVRNANSLESIGITGYSAEWSSILSQLHTPLLRSLAVEYTSTTSEQSRPMIIELPECPTLEQLDLNGYEETRVDLSVLKKLKQLRLLKLSGLTVQYSRDLFKDLATQGSKITSVHFHNVLTTNDAFLLESVTYLRSLTRLVIAFRIEDSYFEDKLRRFAQLLKQTAIQRLMLENINCLTASVLQPLGALPALRTLNVSCNSKPLLNFVVDAPDLLELLNTSSPSLGVVYIGRARFTSIEGESIESFLRQNVGGYRVLATSNNEDGSVKNVIMKKNTNYIRHS